VHLVAPSLDSQLGLCVARLPHIGKACLCLCSVGPPHGSVLSLSLCSPMVTHAHSLTSPCSSSALSMCLFSAESSCSGTLTACFPPAMSFQDTTYCLCPASSPAQASNASGFAVAALSSANEFNAGSVLSADRYSVCSRVYSPWLLHLDMGRFNHLDLGILQLCQQAQDH
jgi:hypothetical protein